MKQHWLLIILLLLAACSTGPRPDAVGVDGGAGLLGVAEVGSEGVSVQALVPGLSFSVISRSVVDSDGIRIQEVTYQIDNTSSRDLRNLTLYGVETPNTIAGTNVSGLRDALGNDITNPNMAPSIIAVHGQDADSADMQAFVEADKVRVKDLFDDIYPNNSFVVLSRGFVASNSTGQGNRAIAVGETGVVTLAVQYPYDPANPADYPDSFTLTFAFVDEDITRVSQGDDESNEAFVNRVTSTFSPLPENLEVVINDTQNPPSFDVLMTVLQSERPNPPISQVDILPTRFTLTVASVNATAEVEVDVVVASEVQSNVEVQQ